MRGRSIGRKAGEREPLKTVYIVCEGTETEPAYFEFMKRNKWERRISNMIKLKTSKDAGGTDRDRLVKYAIELKRDNRGDEVWCVFDVEAPGTFPNLRNTLERARKKGIEIALSNPAFEYWLLLHFVETTRSFANCDEVTSALKNHWHDYDKRNTKIEDFQKIDGSCGDAVERARRIRNNSQPSSHTTDPMPRPSTDVDKLVTYIAEMPKPPY